MLLLTAAAMLANQSSAQPAGAVAEARAEFEQGQAAVEKGELQQGRELFLASQALFPRAGTLLNLADCEEKLGLVASAWQHYHDALALLRNENRTNLVKSRIKLSNDRIVALEPRVPNLRITLAKDSPVDTRVLLDSRELPSAKLDINIPLDPGEHTVTVQAPGRVNGIFKVKVTENQNQMLPVEAGALLETPAPAVLSTPPVNVKPPTVVVINHPLVEPSNNTVRNTGIALGAAGVVGIVIGAVAGGLAIQKKNNLDRICPVPQNPCPNGAQSLQDGEKFGAIASIGLGVGLPLAAAGGILLVVAPKRMPLKASVSFGPTTAGLMVLGAL